MNYFQTSFSNILLAAPNYRSIESCPNKNPVIFANASDPERRVLLTSGVIDDSIRNVKGSNTKVLLAEVLGGTSF